jgi:ATP-dependent helicase HepA
LSVTFDRARALSREDFAFLTRDHPIVRSALDLLLGGQSGSAALVIWHAGGGEALLLEAVFVLECVAPVSLHADRFLPATAVRVVVDHSLRDLSADRALLKARTEPGPVSMIAAPGPLRDTLLPAMLEKARGLAAGKAATIKTAARDAVSKTLGAEIDRLTALGELNDNVRDSEIEALRTHQTALAAAVDSAQLRMDAVRLVQRKNG